MERYNRVEATHTALANLGFYDYEGDWGNDNSVHYVDGPGNEITISQDRNDFVLTHNDYEEPEDAAPELTEKEVYQLYLVAKAGGYEFYIKNPYSRKYKPIFNFENEGNS